MKTTTSRPLTLVHDSNEAKLAPLKVLIIDDQSTGRIVLGEIMRSLDASLEVATFADPVEAIEYARKHAVDMVLTDYKMPNLDGIETIRRLRRIFGYEDVPIVRTGPGSSNRRSTRPPVNCGGAKSTRCFASRRPPSSATR